MVEKFREELKLFLRMHQHTRPSIFRVPRVLFRESPKSFTPRWISLGPSYYPDINWQKFSALQQLLPRNFSADEKFLAFEDEIVFQMKEIEPTIRGSYYNSLHLGPNRLAWVVAVDGCFLLHCLNIYLKGSEEISLFSLNIAEDIIKMENQIPIIVLAQIQRAVNQINIESDYDMDSALLSTKIENELFNAYHGFCNLYCPFNLRENLEPDWLEDCPDIHLLSFMYHSILNNWNCRHPVGQIPLKFVGNWPKEEEKKLEYNKCDQLPYRVSVIQNLFEFIKLSWKKISPLVKLKKSDSKKDPLPNEINSMLSVIHLSKTAKLKFNPTDGGLDSIKFDEVTSTLYLPTITLKNESEVVLRNLLAYEEAAISTGTTPLLVEYVHLMHSIVYTVEDVKLLKEEKIIQGNLTDRQVADMFIGFKSTSISQNDKSNIRKTIDAIMIRYQNSPWIKVCRPIKKFFNASTEYGRLLLVMFGYVSIIIFMFQSVFDSYCQVYGCPKHLSEVWDRFTNISLP